jgi:hypothetical protein
MNNREEILTLCEGIAKEELDSMEQLERIAAPSLSQVAAGANSIPTVEITKIRRQSILAPVPFNEQEAINQVLTSLNAPFQENGTQRRRSSVGLAMGTDRILSASKLTYCILYSPVILLVWGCRCQHSGSKTSKTLIGIFYVHI